MLSELVCSAEIAQRSTGPAGIHESSMLREKQKWISLSGRISKFVWIV